MYSANEQQELNFTGNNFPSKSNHNFLIPDTLFHINFCLFVHMLVNTV